MENSPKGLLESILDYLLVALRYIASGFVALGVYVYLYNPSQTEIKDIGGLLIFAAATIGIITYALHFATLDKILYGVCIKEFLVDNGGFLPKILHTQINEWEHAKGADKYSVKKSLAKYNDYKVKRDTLGRKERRKEKRKLPSLKRHVLFSLANQAYLRSLSNNSIMSEMQKQVEKRLALLTFLYCSFYQIVILNLYFIITNINPRWDFYWPYIWKIILLFAVAVIFIYSAYRFNRRICSREMWLVQNFGQGTQEVKETIKRLASPEATGGRPARRGPTANQQ